MKRTEIQELKTKPSAELKKMLDDHWEKLRVLKFDLEAGKVKNVSEIGKTKKLIARILTFLKQNKNDNG